MPKTVLLLTISLASWLLSFGAHADKPWLLSKYDLDGDQRITHQEVAAHKQGLFARMDQDTNGMVEFQEYEAMDQARRRSLLKARFNKLDQDHDGVVTSGEYRSYRGLFDSIDSNGDGTLTRQEMGGEELDAYVTRCLLWFCLKTRL